MSLSDASLTVRADTTLEQLRSFLESDSAQARTDAGLRARTRIEQVDGKTTEVVVLYVRNIATPGSLGDKIALFLDSVRAYFAARDEYRLAAQTLLERACASVTNKNDDPAGDVCLRLFNAFKDDAARPTVNGVLSAWELAYPQQPISPQAEVISKALKMCKGGEAESGKNWQARSQAVEKGLKDLSYFNAMLGIPYQHLQAIEKIHVGCFYKFLGIKVCNDGPLDLDPVDHFQDLCAIARTLVSQQEAGVMSEQHVKDLMKNCSQDARRFAKRWLANWKSHGNQHAQAKHKHIAAIDYIAGNILKWSEPKDVSMEDVDALLQAIGSDKRGPIYTSIIQSMDKETKDWIEGGSIAEQAPWARRSGHAMPD